MAECSLIPKTRRDFAKILRDNSYNISKRSLNWKNTLNWTLRREILCNQSYKGFGRIQKEARSLSIYWMENGGIIH